MKKTFIHVILSLLIISSISFTSCRDNAASKQQKKVETEQKDTITKSIEENVYPLPTSAQVIKMLTDLEVGFMIGLTNPVENTKKYFNSTKRAINLGVYGADLSYVTLYNMQQDVIIYMNAIRSISNELNLSKVYNAELYDKIKRNFDNKDELVKILTQSFDETYLFLTENDQQPLAVLVVGGAWVEGMYITTHVSEAAYNIPGISKNLLDQKKSFELFLELSKAYISDPSVSDFLKSVEPMQKVYDGIGTSLSEQNIKDITKAITGIREQVVQ